MFLKIRDDSYYFLYSYTIYLIEKMTTTLLDNYEYYLSPDEKQTLNYLNLMSAHLQEDKTKRKSIENMSIKTIYNNWSNTLIIIISDIVNAFELLVSQKKVNDIETGKWWEKYNSFLAELVNIITKDDRLIYVGITFILISIAIHFILISK